MFGAVARRVWLKACGRGRSDELAFGRKIGFEIGFSTAPFVDIIEYIGFDLSNFIF